MNEGELLLKNKIFTVYKAEGIFYIDYRPNLEIDFTIAEELIKHAKEFSKGKETIGIADVSKIKSITKSARDYLSKEENLTHIKACAFIVDDALSKVLATIFLNFNKPVKPFKAFTSMEEARQWLLQFDQEKKAS